jgi:hypothetical protein
MGIADAKIILAMLYAFFELTAAFSANWRTPPDNFLTNAEFKLDDCRVTSFGFGHSDFWRRNTQ